MYKRQANELAASAASLDYVKFQAVIKSAASAASLRGGRASGRLDDDLFSAFVGRASGQKIVKISDSTCLKSCLRHMTGFGIDSINAALDKHIMSHFKPPSTAALLLLLTIAFSTQSPRF